MKKLLVAASCAVLAGALVACTSSRTSAEALAAYGDTGGYEATAIVATPITSADVQRYPTTLGDFDPIKLDDTFGMVLSFGKLKAKQLSKTYLVPRSNTVEVHYRSGANALCLIFGQQSREGFLSAALAFLEGQEQHTLVDAKPTAANSYYSGLCDIFWGVTGTATGCENTVFHTNCKFIDGLPYFVLRVPSARATTSSDSFSPYAELYFSPTQLREFCSVIEQKNLEELVAELSAKAYAY